MSATILAMSYAVRPATSADLPAVAAIYAHAVEHTTATFDTTAPGVDHWQGRLDSPDERDVFLVADSGGEVIGFAYSSAYRPRAAYDRTRETTVYLAEGARGQGVGSALYADLLARLRTADVHTALAVIALPNPASERLHLAAGFTLAGRLAEVGHKFGRVIDVGIFQLMLR